MLTYNEIGDALMNNPPHKVAITSGSLDAQIYGVGESPTSGGIWVTPYGGAKFKITIEHTLTILP